MSSAEEMVKIKKILEKMGHHIILPKNTEEYANGNWKMEDHRESTENKIKHNLIRAYYEEIKGAVNEYIKDVKSFDFPNEKEQY